MLNEFQRKRKARKLVMDIRNQGGFKKTSKETNEEIMNFLIELV